MIAIASAVYPVTRSAAPATRTLPAAEPPCSPDFSTLDSAEKAILLPCLNPAMLAVTVAGLVASSLSEGPTSAAVQLTFAEVQGSLSYNFKNEEHLHTVTAKGNLGPVNYQENWIVDSQKRTLTLDACVGTTAIHLEAEPGQSGLLLKGKVGAMALNQVIYLDPGLEHNQATGQLGNQQFESHLRLDVASPPDSYHLRLDGRLGQAALTQDMTIGTKSEDEFLSFSCQGDLAGVHCTASGRILASVS